MATEVHNSSNRQQEINQEKSLNIRDYYFVFRTYYKLIVAMTENSLASERHNAVKILNLISKFIEGGGGGKPSFAQGGGSNPNGISDALEEARKILGLK